VSVYLVLFRPNAVGFVPLDFRVAYRTIGKLQVSCAFQLPPASLCLPEPRALADSIAGRNGLDIRDASDDLEMHIAARLSSWLQRLKPFVSNLHLAARLNAVPYQFRVLAVRCQQKLVGGGVWVYA
jgi:hypothetical protein